MDEKRKGNRSSLGCTICAIEVHRNSYSESEVHRVSLLFSELNK